MIEGIADVWFVINVYHCYKKVWNLQLSYFCNFLAYLYLMLLQLQRLLESNEK
jgi:hypothetical protein